MLTKTCTLTFSDGAKVTGKIQTDSPEAEQSVEYDGAVERLPKKFHTADAAFLECFFGNLAKHAGATLDVQTEGKFDRWAE